MNIVYCINNNPEYIKMLNESIKSIKLFNKDVSFHIIVNDDKPVKGILQGKQYIHKLNTKFRERLNSKEGPKDRLNNTSYLKLWIPEILKDLDKCMFVDCDCVCFRDLSDVYNADVKYLKLGSIDITNKQRKIELNNIPIYYSTGIMLMNLKALREDSFRTKCFNGMNNIKCSFWCHEETLINYNYYNKIEQFDKNVQYTNIDFYYLHYNDYEPIRKNVNDVCFYHVGGKDKSKFYIFCKYAQEYYKYKRLQELKNIVSVEDFKNKKVKNIIINTKHTQMRRWFNKDYNIVNDPSKAQVAIFHGTNFFHKSIINYTETILKYNIPIISIEDVFLRSVYPAGKAVNRRIYRDSVGYCINNYLYFENNYDTTINKMLLEEKDDYEKVIKPAATNIIDFIIKNKISKYNCQLNEPNTEKGGILVIDQAYSDQSIINANATHLTFKNMLIAAIRENPNDKIFVKVHPESIHGLRGGFLFEEVIKEAEAITNRKVYRITTPINPISLILSSKKVYTVSSGFGFEALMCRKPVVTFGTPFYAGWGLTDDRNPKQKQHKKLTIEHLVYTVFEKYSIFVDQVTYKKISAMAALNYILRLRKQIMGK